MNMAEPCIRRRVAGRFCLRWAMCSCLFSAILFADQNTQAGLLGVFVGRTAANPKSEESGEETKTETLAPCARSARVSPPRLRPAKAPYAGLGRRESAGYQAGGTRGRQPHKHLFPDTGPSPLRC
jgi:hypothetical protein